MQQTSESSGSRRWRTDGHFSVSLLQLFLVCAWQLPRWSPIHCVLSEGARAGWELLSLFKSSTSLFVSWFQGTWWRKLLSSSLLGMGKMRHGAVLWLAQQTHRPRGTSGIIHSPWTALSIRSCHCTCISAVLYIGCYCYTSAKLPPVWQETHSAIWLPTIHPYPWLVVSAAISCLALSCHCLFQDAHFTLLTLDLSSTRSVSDPSAASHSIWKQMPVRVLHLSPMGTNLFIWWVDSNAICLSLCVLECII